MSEIGAIGGGASASGLPRPPQTDGAGRPVGRAEPRARRGEDRVEVSSLARSMSRLSAEPVRQDLIDRVRAEIEAGTYETPDKIEGAVENLLDELGGSA